VGSGVPGNGFVALHLAHAQSLLAILVTPLTMPSIVSWSWDSSVDCVVSRDTGCYGMGFECSMIGCELMPPTFMIRPMTTPVTDEPSGFFGIGTTA
jgi:hypothetical protein